MPLKGILYFAGVTEHPLLPSFGAYSWVLYDDSGNKLAEDSGYSGCYITKDKADYHGLVKGNLKFINSFN